MTPIRHPLRRGRPKALTERERDQLAKLLASGIPVKRIAVALGHPYTTTLRAAQEIIRGGRKNDAPTALDSDGAISPNGEATQQSRPEDTSGGPDAVGNGDAHEVS